MIPLPNLRSKLPALAAALTFGLVLLFASVVEQTAKDPLLSEIADHKRATTAALAAHETTKGTVAALQKRVSALVDSNTKLTEDIRRAKTTVIQAKTGVQAAKDQLPLVLTLRDSTMVLTTIVERQDTVISSQGLQILLMEAQTKNLTQQITIKDSTNALLLADNTKLADLLRTVPAVNPCEQKFFFCKLNKPSRLTTFLAGVGTTLIGVVAIK